VQNVSDRPEVTPQKHKTRAEAQAEWWSDYWEAQTAAEQEMKPNDDATAKEGSMDADRST
jgi:hypothetical protein